MPSKKYLIEQNSDFRESCQADMQAVCTVAEAILVYNKTRKTIEMQINKGRVVYRRSGNTTLLSVESLDALWPRRSEFEGGL